MRFNDIYKRVESKREREREREKKKRKYAYLYVHMTETSRLPHCNAGSLHRATGHVASAGAPVILGA